MATGRVDDPDHGRGGSVDDRTVGEVVAGVRTLLVAIDAEEVGASEHGVRRIVDERAAGRHCA